MAVDTMSKVTKLVAERLGVEEAKVVPTAQFQEDLAADSLDMVELVMSLEEEFGLEIADEELESIKTVQDAVDYIDRQVP